MWKWICRTHLRKRKEKGVASHGLEYEYGRGYYLPYKELDMKADIPKYENGYGR